MDYINLDIGHFTAANDDAVAFLEQKHDRILVLHIKDRKKNHDDAIATAKAAGAGERRYQHEGAPRRALTMDFGPQL